MDTFRAQVRANIKDTYGTESTDGTGDTGDGVTAPAESTPVLCGACGRGLHSFTSELNLSNSRTHS
jgi:hypothetical protein